MDIGFLKDSAGDNSIKRLMGSILLINGILLKNAEWLFGMLRATRIENISLAQDASTLFITAGAGLLGISVLEWFNKKEKNVN